MIEKIIQQLPEEKYLSLCDEVRSKKGEKYFHLLSKYRLNEYNEDALVDELKITTSSYYTLRSRLFDKIQEFLFKNNENESAELMKNVHSISYILHNYEKETAIALLNYLEEELQRFDMQEHLITVYHALKKLHIYSDKYYHYDQCYNKSVAYTLSHHKAENLLSQYSIKLSDYILSGDPSQKDVLLLYLHEISNINALYNSFYLKLLLDIGYINYTLFVDENFSAYSSITTDQLLNGYTKVISGPIKSAITQQLLFPVQFLTFQYFHQNNLHKNNEALFQLILEKNVLLLNLNTVTCPYLFFISVLERNHQNGEDVPAIKKYFDSFPAPDEKNEHYFICYYLGLTALHYEMDDIKEALSSSQKLINSSAIKKYEAVEIEIRLFNIFLLLIDEKPDVAESALRSITRKLQGRELNERINLFIKILKSALSASSSTKQKKIFDNFRIFNMITGKENAFLNYIKIKERHILQIASY